MTERKYVDRRLVVNEILIAYCADLLHIEALHKHQIKARIEKDFDDIFKNKRIDPHCFENLLRAAERYNLKRYDITLEEAKATALARIDAIQNDPKASNRDKLMANQQYIDIFGCCAKYSGGGRKYDPEELNKILKEIETDEQHSA